MPKEQQRKLLQSPDWIAPSKLEQIKLTSIYQKQASRRPMTAIVNNARTTNNKYKEIIKD